MIWSARTSTDCGIVTPRLCGLHVDDDFELGGLHTGKIGGLGALEDLIHVRGGLPVELTEARPVRHEAPGLHILAEPIHRWQSVLYREFYEPRSVEQKHGVRHY